MAMKSIKSLLALLFLLMLNFQGWAQQTITGSFVYDGINRTWRLYVPASYNPANAAPLVLNLHGYGSNNLEQEFYGDFRPIADTAGFLLVHPNGTPDGFGIMHWNTFGTSNVDDVGFLSALIDTISVNYHVNPDRIYSTGMSNGGFMSFSLACELSHRIAAIASVTGTMIPARLASCNPERPVPVMQIHGTADGTVPYNGSPFFVPVQTLLNYWINHNNCTATPIITEVPDIDPDDGCTAENHLYPGGDNGSVVEHYKVLGGGHSWPGAPVNLNVTNMDFSASQEIWRFFRGYNLDGLITAANEIHDIQVPLTAYPNPSRGETTITFSHMAMRQISVMDYTGRLINSYITEDASIRLNLPATGIYLVVVKQDGQLHTIKLIKQ
jgi:polyhydroxybutyrate depolymerase